MTHTHPDAKCDINLFLKFLPKFNAISIFDYKPNDASFELDARLQGYERLGVIINSCCHYFQELLGLSNYPIGRA